MTLKNLTKFIILDMFFAFNFVADKQEVLALKINCVEDRSCG